MSWNHWKEHIYIITSQQLLKIHCHAMHLLPNKVLRRRAVEKEQIVSKDLFHLFSVIDLVIMQGRSRLITLLYLSVLLLLLFIVVVVATAGAM